MQTREGASVPESKYANIFFHLFSQVQFFLFSYLHKTHKLTLTRTHTRSHACQHTRTHTYTRMHTEWERRVCLLQDERELERIREKKLEWNQVSKTEPFFLRTRAGRNKQKKRENEEDEEKNNLLFWNFGNMNVWASRHTSVLLVDPTFPAFF